MKQSLF